MISVFVCYSDHGWDGCAPPEQAFWTEQEAQDYCKARDKSWSSATYEYKEFEMNEATIRSDTGA